MRNGREEQLMQVHKSFHPSTSKWPLICRDRSLSIGSSVGYPSPAIQHMPPSMSVSVNNALLRNASRLTDLERHPRKWVADEQSQYELAFEHITSDKVSCDQTTLNSLQTVPKESSTVIRLNQATVRKTSKSYSLKSAGSREVTEVEMSGKAERSLTATVKRTFDGNHRQLVDFTQNSRHHIEGLVSFPNSQVMIRNSHSGPAILAFTNNYTKPVIWALKTNAIRRLAAFPTSGVIPPCGTVQIKIALVGQMPRKTLKDRLSLEYFVTNRKFSTDGNNCDCSHLSELTRMKKCLEVVYIQQ